MIEVNVNINREATIAQIAAVRMKPKSEPEEGEECTYDLYVFGEKVDRIKVDYGCGINLSIKMLEAYKKKEKIYKILALEKMNGKTYN